MSNWVDSQEPWARQQEASWWRGGKEPHSKRQFSASRWNPRIWVWVRRKEGNMGLYVHRNHYGLLGTGKFEGSGIFISNTYSLQSPPEWLCTKVGSCVSHFNVSLIVWEKPQDSVHKPQFLKRKESQSGSNQGPSAYQPSALPLGHTSSQRVEVRFQPRYSPQWLTGLKNTHKKTGVCVSLCMSLVYHSHDEVQVGCRQSFGFTAVLYNR